MSLSCFSLKHPVKYIPYRYTLILQGLTHKINNPPAAFCGAFAENLSHFIWSRRMASFGIFSFSGLEPIRTTGSPAANSKRSDAYIISLRNPLGKRNIVQKHRRFGKQQRVCTTNSILLRIMSGTGDEIQKDLFLCVYGNTAQYDRSLKNPVLARFEILSCSYGLTSEQSDRPEHD